MKWLKERMLMHQKNKRILIFFQYSIKIDIFEIFSYKIINELINQNFFNF